MFLIISRKINGSQYNKCLDNRAYSPYYFKHSNLEDDAIETGDHSNRGQ